MTAFLPVQAMWDFFIVRAVLGYHQWFNWWTFPFQIIPVASTYFDFALATEEEKRGYVLVSGRLTRLMISQIIRMCLREQANSYLAASANQPLNTHQ